AALPICAQAQLSINFDSENGNFDGMSHSGTLLVLRNLGPAPCQLPALPALIFQNRHGRVLDIAARATGNAPAPRLAVGAEATAALRWVSSPVYSHSHCLKSAQLSVSWPGGKLSRPLPAFICEADGGPASVAQAPLATDPPPPHS
ncbi:MAG: DUF4232 domain-containing protein, partial [Rhodospirillales bacterium]|nr:DUF4232 domain-containing protein [Rhodospirillales bacterium]